MLRVLLQNRVLGFGLVVLAALLLASFIMWNRYKEEIARIYPTICTETNVKNGGSKKQKAS